MSLMAENGQITDVAPTWKSTAESTWSLTAADSVWQFVSQDDPSHNLSPNQDQRVNKIPSHFESFTPDTFEKLLATPQPKSLQKQNFDFPRPTETETRLATPQKSPRSYEKSRIEAKASNICQTPNNERTFSRSLESDRSEKHLATPAQILSKKLVQSSYQSPGIFLSSQKI